MAKRVAPTSSIARRAQRGTASIDDIAGEVNKEFGDGTMVRAGSLRGVNAVPKMPTGSIAYDLALGGGIPVNKWSEIVGRESAGKTTFAFKAIAAAQRANPEHVSLWVASEDLDVERAEDCGVDLDRLMIFEENVMELVYDKVVDVARRRAADLVVIDSYPQLVTNVEDEEDINGGKVQAGAKITNIFFRQVSKATKRSLLDPNDRPLTGLFVNQWRSRVGVMFGDPRTTSGGEGKNYAFWARLEITREGWVKDGDRLLGQQIGLNVFKNKQAPPRDAAVVDYYFRDHGHIAEGEYDTGGELLNLGLAFDVVEKRGSTYAYDGVTFKGKDAFARSVLGEPALFSRIEGDIRREAWRREHPRKSSTSKAEATGRTVVRRRGRGA